MIISEKAVFQLLTVSSMTDDWKMVWKHTCKPSAYWAEVATLASKTTTVQTGDVTIKFESLVF